jgi:hypothetical protein
MSKGNILSSEMFALRVGVLKISAMTEPVEICAVDSLTAVLPALAAASGLPPT